MKISTILFIIVNCKKIIFNDFLVSDNLHNWFFIITG